MIYVIVLVAAAVALFGVVLYNSLVKSRQMAEEAWSGIDVQLKRRADLIPNLIETVKGYAAHEKSTLEGVIELRNKAQAIPAGDVATRGAAENLLGVALGRVMAIAEAYPDLKANSNFLEMQRALDGIEGEIQMARRYYNGSARELNIKIESVPSNLIAGPFGFVKKDYFEITNEADRALPQVKF
ncbi:LemA family protein [Rhizobium sp.]